MGAPRCLAQGTLATTRHVLYAVTLLVCTSDILCCTFDRGISSFITMCFIVATNVNFSKYIHISNFDYIGICNEVLMYDKNYIIDRNYDTYRERVILYAVQE